MLGGLLQQNRQEAFQGFLFVPLWGKGEGRITVIRQWHGQESGQKRHRLFQREPILAEHLLQFRQLLLWAILWLPSQGALQEVNDGIQSSVLIIGRTATLPPRMCFPCYMFFEHLHEARLANPRLTTQDDHVPHAVLDLGPAFLQQRHFRGAPNQRCQPVRRCHVEPGLRRTGVQNAIDL